MYKLTQGWPQRIADGAFVNPENNTEYLAWLAEGNTPLPVDPVPVLPIVVSPRQIKQALDQVGLYDAVESAVTVGNRQLKIWWNDATAFEENHPMVVGMAASLNVSETQLHDLFVLASTL